MTKTTSDLANFIIDLEDEECPNFGLHVAAYQGDILQLKDLLSKPEYKQNIDARIRPFLATPLRLAATAGCYESIEILLEHGAEIDKTDVKAQTPLFIAMVNQHWKCGTLLLEKGADPNGHEKNLCTPLAVMAQRGYYEGIRILCRYGADTEDVYRLMTGLPGFPITITATYHHLNCFACLLVHGAKPDLTHLSHLELPAYVTTQCSVPHAIIKYRCPPEFVYLYREFGGSLWIKDSRDRLATEITDRAPALSLMKQLQGCPLSLRSLCRLKIRRCFGRERLGMLENLENLNLEFLTYREFEPNNPHEREKIFSDPTMEMMLASLTNMMKEQVSPKDLPNYILLHQTAFEGYDIGDDKEAGISAAASDLNARVQALSNPLRLLKKKKRSSKQAQGCKP